MIDTLKIILSFAVLFFIMIYGYLYHEFLRNNITVEPVIGYNTTENQDYAHAFIKVTVYIEPQTGKVVNFEKEYENIVNYDEAMQSYRDNLYNLEVTK